MTDISWVLENDELGKIINKLPGLAVFIRDHIRDDFEDLMIAYISHLKDIEKYTFGIGANINVLRSKFKKLVLEANHTPDTKASFYKSESLDIPAWEKIMSIHEREHLDSLIHRLPQLDIFLKDYFSNPNLTEVISLFEEQYEKPLKSDKAMALVVNSVKRYFQDKMEKHEAALHFVSTEKQINDLVLLTDFFYDAKENFYRKNLAVDDCQKFLSQYIGCMHPYIDAEIGGRYLKYKIYPTAMVFYSHVFHHIFSSPNIFWNNSEGVYGCAEALEDVVKICHDNSPSSNADGTNEIFGSMVELCYLFASRVVYWNDKGTQNSPSHHAKKMPIRIQDRIHFYEARTYLLSCFPHFFYQLGLSEVDIARMKYADLKDLHQIAYNEGIVGSNSVYVKQKREIEDQYFKDESMISHTYGSGKKLSEDTAWKLYCNYTKGKYCLSWDTVQNILSIPNNIQDVRWVEHDLKYKEDRVRIREYLRENGVKWFYHFTERDKLSSIKREGGLLSYRQCLTRGIVMPKTIDMSKSRDIDAAFNLEDYVRVSFCRYLPKIEERKKEDKDLVLLRISAEVAELYDTLFTDIEATRQDHKHGPAFENLQKVDIKATQKNYCDSSDPDYWQYQSEVMIKGMIPIQFILNIDNPENL